ncbi:MAG: hypothetical protein ABIB98_01895 [bacterium]
MLKIIGFGGENIVYKINNNTVIKKPFGIRYFINPFETTNEILADLKILQVYFKNFLPLTKIIPCKNILGFPSYTMAQYYVKGTCLKKRHLKIEKVRQQLLEIMKINEDMVKSENKSYEFFGIWTLLLSTVLKRFSNILVEEGTNKLYIIDIGILYLGEKYHSKLLGFIYKWAKSRQRVLLAGFVN